MTGERGSALWQLGFRPFYLLAAIFAAISVGVWTAQFAGILPWVGQSGPSWHGHEMIFGYALAVIAGFLFGIVRNWTQRPTPTGAALVLIVALWLAGRLLACTPWGAATALANIAFMTAVAIGVAVPLWQARSRQNYLFIGLLALVLAALVLFHLSALDWITLPAWVGLQAGLDGILLVIAAVAGRVVPIYANNAVPGARARRSQNVERLAMGSLFVLLVADLLALPAIVLIAALIATALVHAWRLRLWDCRSALRVPLLWVLYLAYAWIPVHLVLRALHEADWVARPLAVHAFTIGTIGGMTMAMMIRTARAWTGRALTADAADVACCVLLAAAAVLRVFWPLLAPAQQVDATVYSGVLWSAAFLLFAVRHAPALLRPRPDGRPG